MEAHEGAWNRKARSVKAHEGPWRRKKVRGASWARMRDCMGLAWGAAWRRKGVRGASWARMGVCMGVHGGLHGGAWGVHGRVHGSAWGVHMHPWSSCVARVWPSSLSGSALLAEAEHLPPLQSSPLPPFPSLLGLNTCHPCKALRSLPSPPHHMPRLISADDARGGGQPQHRESAAGAPRGQVCGGPGVAAGG